jgi:hypothetical protein
MGNKCELEPSEIVARGQIKSDSQKRKSPKEGEGDSKRKVSKRKRMYLHWKLNK